MTTEAAPNGPGFLARAWAWLEEKLGWVKNEVHDLSHDIAQLGDKVANELKNGKYTSLIEGGLVQIATAINPALGALVSGFELQLPKLIAKITGLATDVEGESEKTPAELEQELANYLEGLKGISGTAYANAIGGLNAIVQEYATQNSGSIIAEPATLIAAAQVIHAANAA